VAGPFVSKEEIILIIQQLQSNLPCLIANKFQLLAKKSDQATFVFVLKTRFRQKSFDLRSGRVEELLLIY